MSMECPICRESALKCGHTRDEMEDFVDNIAPAIELLERALPYVADPDLMREIKEYING